MPFAGHHFPFHFPNVLGHRWMHLSDRQTPVLTRVELRGLGSPVPSCINQVWTLTRCRPLSSRSYLRDTQGGTGQTDGAQSLLPSQALMGSTDSFKIVQ